MTIVSSKGEAYMSNQDVLKDLRKAPEKAKPMPKRTKEDLDMTLRAAENYGRLVRGYLNRSKQGASSL